MLDFIEIYDDVLNEESCSKIIEIFEKFSEEGKTHRGKVSQHPKANSNYAEVEGIKLSEDLAISCEKYFSDELIRELSDIAFSALNVCVDDYVNKYPQLRTMFNWSLENEWNVQKYVDGEGYYKSHCEHGPTCPYRIFVWMIYLNDAKCGTEFVTYDKIVEAKRGRLVLWPAGFTHYHRGVCPNIGTKYICTGWYSFINDGIKPLI